MELDQIFKSHLPDSLYLDHYTLSNTYGHTPNEWRQYLKDNEHFITSETAAIAEAQARNALNNLGKGASTQEVSAIKALLDKSKLINDAQKQQQHVMLTYLPNKQQTSFASSKDDSEEVTFLNEYINTIILLHMGKEFNPAIHTKEWYKTEKERHR